MSRLPITVSKIKILLNPNQRQPLNPVNQFMVTLEEKNENWSKYIFADRKDLIGLRDQINAILDSETTADQLGVSDEQGKIIDEHYEKDVLCKSCKYKLTKNCNVCLFTLQSPLERTLYLELKKSYVDFYTQHGLNWKGEYISTKDKTYNDVNNNFKNVLTIVDFYIVKGTTKLCVYTDGHTYHERTEEQAQKDRNIDRKLQELGFKVLRYTGKDVNENVEKIISEIKRWLY